MRLDEKSSCFQRAVVFSNHNYRQLQTNRKMRHSNRVAPIRSKAVKRKADEKTAELLKRARLQIDKLAQEVRHLRTFCSQQGMQPPPFVATSTKTTEAGQVIAAKKKRCPHCYSEDHKRSSHRNCPCYGACTANCKKQSTRDK